MNNIEIEMEFGGTLPQAAIALSAASVDKTAGTAVNIDVDLPKSYAVAKTINLVLAGIQTDHEPWGAGVDAVISGHGTHSWPNIYRQTNVALTYDPGDTNKRVTLTFQANRILERDRTISIIAYGDFIGYKSITLHDDRVDETINVADLSDPQKTAIGIDNLVGDGETDYTDEITAIFEYVASTTDDVLIYFPKREDGSPAYYVSDTQYVGPYSGVLWNNKDQKIAFQGDGPGSSYIKKLADPLILDDNYPISSRCRCRGIRTR